MMKLLSNNEKFGVILVLSFVVLGAIRDVLIGHHVQGNSPHFMLLATFIPTWTFFLFFQFNKMKSFIKKVNESLPTIILVNLFTFGAWTGGYLALQYIQPSVEACLVFGSGPLFTLLIMKSKNRTKRKEYFIATGIFLSALLLSYFCLFGQSGVTGYTFKQIILGLFFAIISGFSVSGYLVFSKKLMENQWSTKQVMAVRFPLLIAFSAILFCFDKTEVILSNSILIALCIIVIFGTILPFFLLQEGLGKIKPSTVSFLLYLTPLLSLFIEQLDSRITFSIPIIVGVLLSSAIMFIGVFSKST